MHYWCKVDGDLVIHIGLVHTRVDMVLSENSIFKLRQTEFDIARGIVCNPNNTMIDQLRKAQSDCLNIGIQPTVDKKEEEKNR